MSISANITLRTVVARRECFGERQFTIRHVECEIILPAEGKDRCSPCFEYHRTLTVLSRRYMNVDEMSVEQRINPSSHTDFRFLKTPEKTEQLQLLHRENRVIQKKMSRMQSKLKEVFNQQAIDVNEATDGNLKFPGGLLPTSHYA